MIKKRNDKKETKSGFARDIYVQDTGASQLERWAWKRERKRDRDDGRWQIGKMEKVKWLGEREERGERGKEGGRKAGKSLREEKWSEKKMKKRWRDATKKLDKLAYV